MKYFFVAITLLVSASTSWGESESDFWLAFSVDTPPKPIDHSPWQKLLGGHMQSNAHPTWGHRFDPSGFSRKEKKQLKSYIQSMEKIDPRYYSYDEQLAYWLNLYNAITVSFMVDADDFGDIKSHRDKKAITVAGKKISQRYIAENILMPIWQDSSIYFLLSCGALDCPPVPYEAFTPANARQQAKKSMQAYMNGPEGLRLDSGTLYLPRAFEHFSSYYGSSTGMMKKLAFSVSDDLAIKLLGHDGPIVYSQHMALASPDAK